MKTLLKILGGIGTILILNFLINLIFVSKNSGKDFVETYIKNSQKNRIYVKSEHFDEMFNGYNYYKGSIFFKGIFGGSSNYTFKDNLSKKYFKIVRFDSFGKKFSYPQTYKIDNKELIVKVDPLQYNDKTFGTKENPILVFWYEGVNEKLMTDIRTVEKDKDGFYINKDVQLSPTEEEYRYNVEQYLTYVMPKEEFKKRFKN